MRKFNYVSPETLVNNYESEDAMLAQSALPGSTEGFTGVPGAWSAN